MNLLDRMYRWLRSAPRRSGSVVVSRAYLQNRKRVRGEFHFVTFSEAIEWTRDWLRSFPRRYDVVVGIPRSGIAIASVISLKLGLPLTTPDHLAHGDWWFSAEGEMRWKNDRPLQVLLVDDSISSGSAMAEALAELDSCPHAIEVTRAALIASEETTSDQVDLWYRKIPRPRFFEWNILHRKLTQFFGDDALAVRFEDVLCMNPQGSKSLAEAQPFLVPAFEIDTVFSALPETARAAVEAWLCANEVRYASLELACVAPDRKLLQLKPGMVWESDVARAESMFASTSIPTLAIDEMVLLS